MPSQALTPQQVLTLLAETPTRIAALTTGLAPADLQTSPTLDAWSANQVLAHLRASADVQGERIATIIATDRPTFRAVSPRAWIKRTDYLEQEFPSSLSAFTAQRSQLLAVLEPLPPEVWSRAATVRRAGTALEWTLLFCAQGLARHEHEHIEQIEGIVTTVRNRAR